MIFIIFIIIGAIGFQIMINNDDSLFLILLGATMMLLPVVMFVL